MAIARVFNRVIQYSFAEKFSALRADELHPGREAPLIGRRLRLRDGANNWQTGKFVHYNKALKKYRVEFQNEDFEYLNVEDMKDLDATLL